MGSDGCANEAVPVPWLWHSIHEAAATRQGVGIALSGQPVVGGSLDDGKVGITVTMRTDDDYTRVAMQMVAVAGLALALVYLVAHA